VAEYQHLPEQFYSYFDVIILTASQSSPKSSNNLLQVVYNDIMSFAYITSILKQHQKLIYFSSAAVYGDTKNLLAVETTYNAPNNYYDLSKLCIDNITIASKKQIFGLRIGTVNGPAPVIRTDLLINKMYFDATSKGLVSMCASDVNRSIVGVNDLCRATESVIINGNLKNKGIYNVCSINTSTKTVAHTMAGITCVPLEMCETYERSPYSFLMDCNKFCNTFSFIFSDTIESITEQLIESGKDCVVTKCINEYKPDFELKTTCRVCDTATCLLLDLGNQPLANNYHTEYEILNNYPLQLHYCTSCFHVQLNCTVNPDILFKNYLYVSGTSNTGKEYFYNFAKKSIQRLKDTGKLVNELKVLDIACNDGSQLDAYIQVAQELDLKIVTVGVDPASNLHQTSSSKGHDVHCAFFDLSTSNTLLEMYGSFDIIVAQNVFAHVDYPSDFLGYCKTLSTNSTIIYIQTSQATMIQKGEWDTAYHEHLSFFNTNSMKYLCTKNGLTLNSVELVNIHGTSYLFEITFETTDDCNVPDALYREIENDLYTVETYINYGLKCKLNKNNIHNKLLQYKLDGYNIIGFGSTAKSNTLLNYCGINTSIIDFIVDENKLKCGLLTPGTNIEIVDKSFLQYLNPNKKYVIVVFAWNFFEEIFSKIRDSVDNNLNIVVLNINPLQVREV
jgi:nucleoside-diphosphate-sugar epimerase/2-polyprenyl-3-methyl-5-hydroxy-6-metoxy-1,4-benzoquinol methylase